jgi:hypothetical protein
MSDVKKRKMSDESAENRGEAAPQDVHIVYTNATGREVNVNSDHAQILRDTLGAFYVAEITLSQKGYQAMQKSESGDVFWIKMRNPGGKTFNLVGDTSGDGGWHSSSSNVWWTAFDAKDYQQPLFWRLTCNNHSLDAYAAYPYEEKQTHVKRFLDFVGVEHACAVPFREIFIDFTKRWVRRAYIICKDLREKKYVEMAEAEAAASDNVGTTNVANVAALMTESLNRIARDALGDLRDT